jgi:hypothetical protein
MSASLIEEAIEHFDQAFKMDEGCWKALVDLLEKTREI